MSRTIALMSDFGLRDTYVGLMKGVILGIAPEVNLVDITHNIDPQHVRQAAFMLQNAFQYYPKGTVFLVVVDPGVGSMRRPIAIQAGDYSFVAPDNGVLSYVLAVLDKAKIVELTNKAFWLTNVTRTFHGRDIFAPVAAHLANGTELYEFGAPLERIVCLPKPELSLQGNEAIGEIIHIDHFGNIITSIGDLWWQDEELLHLRPAAADDHEVIAVSVQNSVVKCHGETIYSLRASYSEALRGDLLALIGSTGHLEIAVNQGNAAERLDVMVGDRVTLEIGDVDAAISD